MMNHEQFEEMCALAVTGELTEEEFHLLNSHLDACDSCSDLYRDFVRMGISVLPPAMPQRLQADLNNQALDNEQSARLKERFRKALSTKETAIDLPVAQPSGFSYYKSAAAAVAIAGILTGAIPVISHLYRSRRSVVPTVKTPVPALASAPNPAEASKESEMATEVRKLQQQIEALSLEKQKASLHANSLNDEIAVLRKSLGENSASTSSFLREQERLHALNETQTLEIQRLREQVSTLQEQRGQQARILASRDEKIRFLTASLETERPRMRPAADDLQSLMGARQLHLIDVFDTDVSGKRKKAFGRVFYTEGESLLFYAFDLQAGASLNYHAWGQLEGSSKEVTSLGTFQPDNTQLQRWVLRVSDTKILRRIDSVFVTVEKNQEIGKPKGQPFLYAYLHQQPNHP